MLLSTRRNSERDCQNSAAIKKTGEHIWLQYKTWSSNFEAEPTQQPKKDELPVLVNLLNILKTFGKNVLERKYL